MLKIILGIIFALVATFFTVGFFSPEINYRTSVDIEAPLDHTFAVYNDTTRMGEWLEGFISLSAVSGEANEVGSEWLMTFEGPDGAPIEMHETVTAFVENEHFGFTIDSDMMEAASDVRFSALDGNRTRIEANTTSRGKSLMWRSMLRLMHGSIAQQDVANHERLKALVESTPLAQPDSTSGI